MQLFDTECKALIAWAKRMPQFTCLSIEDQTNSIETNFLDVILIDCVWKSMQAASKREDSSSPSPPLTLNQYLQLDRAACKRLGIDDVYDRVVVIVDRLRSISFAKEEYLCLKALSLFKSDFGFTNRAVLDEFRMQCFQALRAATSNAEKTSSSTQHLYRYDSIVVLLADLKWASMRLMNTLGQFAGVVGTEKSLLFDMITSNTSPGLDMATIGAMPRCTRTIDEKRV